MKIVRIIARLNVGGPARHVVWLANALQDDEFQTILAAGRVPPGEEDMSYLAAECGVAPVFIDEMSRELSANDAVSLIKVYRLLRRERPDIVHTHTAKAGTVGRAAAFFYKWLTPAALIGRPRRLAVVHTFHGHVFHGYYGSLKTSVFLMIEKLLAQLVTDKIVVISDQQHDEIHRQYRIGSEEQFAVVRLGIETNAFAESAAAREEMRRQLGTGDSGLIVGFIGRLTEIKNIPLFLDVIQAYEKLGESDSPRLTFVIAGDGHLRTELEELAAAKGITKLTFLGSRRDVEKVYSAIDIVALTSLNEGTPLSLIEGMAARKPVISTMVGGVVDLLGGSVELHDGFSVHERGIGVASLTSNDLLNGLIYLAKNERLRVELASRGHEFVQNNYGKDRLIEDMKSLYRDLASRPGNRA